MINEPKKDRPLLWFCGALLWIIQIFPQTLNLSETKMPEGTTVLKVISFLNCLEGRRAGTDSAISDLQFTLLLVKLWLVALIGDHVALNRFIYIPPAIHFKQMFPRWINVTESENAWSARGKGQWSDAHFAGPNFLARDYFMYFKCRPSWSNRIFIFRWKKYWILAVC